MNKNIRRGVAALATAFACLILMASPASATDFTVEVTGGDVVITNSTGTSTETIPLDGTGTCPPATIIVSHDTTSVIDVPTFTSTGRFQLTSNGTYYIAVITRLSSTAGTSTGGTISGVGLTLRADIFLAADQTSTTGSCDPTGTRLCRFTIPLTLAATITTTQTTTSLHISDILHLTSASGTLAVTPPCTSTFTAFNGGTANAVSTFWHVVS